MANLAVFHQLHCLVKLYNHDYAFVSMLMIRKSSGSTRISIITNHETRFSRRKTLKFTITLVGVELYGIYDRADVC